MNVFREWSQSKVCRQRNLNQEQEGCDECLLIKKLIFVLKRNHGWEACFLTVVDLLTLETSQLSKNTLRCSAEGYWPAVPGGATRSQQVVVKCGKRSNDLKKTKTKHCCSQRHQFITSERLVVALVKTEAQTYPW